jgi:hypothetical protein
MRRGKLPFIGISFFSFFCFLFFFHLSLLSATVPLKTSGLSGCARGRLVAPACPFPHLACCCLTSMEIYRGAGENPFRSWMQLNSLYFASSPALI